MFLAPACRQLVRAGLSVRAKRLLNEVLGLGLSQSERWCAGHVAFLQGRILTREEPEVSLLGVYSGAPLLPSDPDENPIDLGVVWYASLIPEIVASEIDYAAATRTS